MTVLIVVTTPPPATAEPRAMIAHASRVTLITDATQTFNATSTPTVTGGTTSTATVSTPATSTPTVSDG